MSQHPQKRQSNFTEAVGRFNQALILNALREVRSDGGEIGIVWDRTVIRPLNMVCKNLTLFFLLK